MLYHIFIISVKDSPRRDHVLTLKQKIELKGAQVTIIDAYYWKSTDVYDELFGGGVHLFRYPGLCQAHIGVFVSHRKAWQTISNMPEDTTYIILEDDMDISDDFSLAELDKCIQSAPIPHDAMIFWKHPHQASHQNEHVINEYLSKFYYNWGLCAYSITPTLAKKLLDGIKLFNQPVDEILIQEWFPKFNSYISIKNYFINEGFIGEGDTGKYKFKSLVWSM